MEGQALRDSPNTVARYINGISFEEYIRGALRSKDCQFTIGPSCLDDGDLIVFPATSRDGAPCEVQCFVQCTLPDKLYLSRKRRIQRLKRSQNLIYDIHDTEVRIIISRKLPN
ncbi:hypothetical protein F4803DRAFT_507742 [Xylaria telfairii]|nr:hypothetical protein F4803DRAFT_507742 [Xylaria telfairii]